MASCSTEATEQNAWKRQRNAKNTMSGAAQIPRFALHQLINIPFRDPILTEIPYQGLDSRSLSLQLNLANGTAFALID